MTARFLSETAQQALAYGVLVSIVRDGGTGLDAAFVAVAASLPAATLGLLGGVVADSLPRRVALMTGYLLQAAVCLLVPTLFGAELLPLLLLVFAFNAFGQLSGPSEQSVVPLIVRPRELATANSFKDLASSGGQAAGQALLAPILVKLFGIEPVLYAAGLLLVLAAVRVASLQGVACSRPAQRIRLSGITGIVPWVLGQPKIASMMALTILASLTGLMVLSLGPVYVATLGADPADTVYVFAPAAAGMIASMSFVPWAARTIGERRAAAIGFVTALAAVLGLGLLSALSRMPQPPPAEARLIVSAALALPIGFGLTTVSAAVLTYTNRKVPHSHQARVFALQSTVRNAASLGPMLAMGALASAAGVQAVLLAAPLLLLASALLIAGDSFRWIFAGPDDDLLVERSAD